MSWAFVFYFIAAMFGFANGREAKVRLAPSWLRDFFLEAPALKFYFEFSAFIS
jgi:hypothetical protein